MARYLHETYDVERGPQRFRELIVYASKKCANDPHFGAIKLNKILYHSDFRAFERFGVPLTGVRYQKLQFGPAPKSLLLTRRSLIEEGAIRLDKAPLVWGYEQHRTVALRSPVMSLFSDKEIQLVDEVISDLWGKTGTEVSDASHDVRWRVVNMHDSMPYELAHLSNEEFTSRDRTRTEELATQFGW